MRPVTIIWKLLLGVIGIAVLPSHASSGQIFNVTIHGSDAIFLAGRSDVVIPLASEPWLGPGTRLRRHTNPTPEEIQETLPEFIAVKAGDEIQVQDPAVGGVNFLNGFGPPYFGPSGNGASGSAVESLDGISGYRGPEGPLTGVFLDDSLPSLGPAPEILDFTLAGLGTNFTTLSPSLQQVFYIGDGVTSSGEFQSFIAPAGATRLFLGIPDGFFFDGAPGAYDDNDGSYQINVDVISIPEPSSVAILSVGSIALMLTVGRRKSRRCLQSQREVEMPVDPSSDLRGL